MSMDYATARTLLQHLSTDKVAKFVVDAYREASK